MELGTPTGLEAYRFNRDTDHDTSCCSFCGAGGRDTLVAAVPEDVFADPPAGFERHLGRGSIAQRVKP